MARRVKRGKTDDTRLADGKDMRRGAVQGKNQNSPTPAVGSQFNFCSVAGWFP